MSELISVINKNDNTVTELVPAVNRCLGYSWEGTSDPVGWKEMTEAKIKTCMYPKVIEVPPQANRLCDHYCYSAKCYVLIWLMLKCTVQKH